MSYLAEMLLVTLKVKSEFSPSGLNYEKMYILLLLFYSICLFQQDNNIRVNY